MPPRGGLLANGRALIDYLVQSECPAEHGELFEIRIPLLVAARAVDAQRLFTSKELAQSRLIVPFFGHGMTLGACQSKFPCASHGEILALLQEARLGLQQKDAYNAAAFLTKSVRC